ncbi:YdcH family protein [Silvimonas sp.]|uniref:YdcH family protein n=1 Tax=Silvimonas sp. TaxID=2650811 RepID=UPI00284AD83F|nr:YdcH family protein [Silvimonas sp.]MDR3427449.1 YdcH family protein [Silvimonas sp.]
MFPEYRDLISSLKNSNPHFSRLFNQHNELDQKIKNIESQPVGFGGAEVETLKKEKLRLKDELYVLLKQAAV